jgi:hypothetical protein
VPTPDYNVVERDTGRHKHKEERRTNKGEEERDNNKVGERDTRRY